MRCARAAGLALLLLVALVPGAAALGVSDPEEPPLTPDCRMGPAQLTAGSLALGLPFRGRLRGGLPFPAETSYAFTWDFPLDQTPSRTWRRWGTQRLVLTVECVLWHIDAAHPLGQRVGVADLSRPHGGPFGAKYGGQGHDSHQNGLDADVLYPRRDGEEEPARTVAEVDVPRAQELVSAFVAAGAQYVFVSPSLFRRGLLRGPRGVVQPLVYHDDHLHVRLRP